MSSLNIEKTFKSQLESIWNNEKYQSISSIKRGYAVQRDIPFESILFIGINPSFNELKDTNSNFFYNTNDYEKVHQYFSRFIDIKNRIGLEWSHLDLLYLRETKQENVKEIFKDKIGKEFLNEQLQLSKSIIEKSNPKIIVVSNAYARDLFKGQCNLKTEFDDNIGTDRIVNNEYLIDIPVFFTSMLTGQRALDNGSYERLVWHIKYVLNSLK